MIAIWIVLVLLFTVVGVLGIVAVASRMSEPVPVTRSPRSPRSAWVDVVTDRQAAKQGDMALYRNHYGFPAPEAFEADASIDVQPIQKGSK